MYEIEVGVLKKVQEMLDSQNDISTDLNSLKGEMYDYLSQKIGQITKAYGPKFQSIG